ncbi:MAG: hypothetical protein K8S00_03630 [Bacteroidales bacterium]|nr:hypothetical protein [Bacteroidales bacterium]
MRNILIRVDYSSNIGYGHIIRMLALAESLLEKEWQSVFLIKQFEETTNLLQNNGFDITFINPNISVNKEIDIIKSLTIKHKLNVVILDISNPYSFCSEYDYVHYIELLKTNNYFVISFNEFYDNYQYTDIIVIPYVNAETKLVSSFNDKSKYLLGPDYFILRPEFIDIEKNAVSKDVNTLFISMGGGNVSEFTEKAIRAILKLEKPYHVKVIITSNAPFDYDLIYEAKRWYSGEIELIVDCCNMAGQMAFSDIAIINSGLTKYETLTMGVPTIVISNSIEHSVLMDEFVKSTNSLIHLGCGLTISEEELSDKIMTLDEDIDLRKELSETGKKLVDGKGIKRLIEIINDNI